MQVKIRELTKKGKVKRVYNLEISAFRLQWILEAQEGNKKFLKELNDITREKL